MIPRYALAEMAALFSDEARLASWLEVELLAVEGWASLGVVPAEDARQLRQRAPRADAGLVAAVAEREAVTNHDTAAFVDVVQEAVGVPAAGWVHYGLTSSDVVDTALSATLVRAADLLIEASTALVGALKG
ncbi:MAG TPA: lyase family protein, partial [Acidimicrobiales bacterium]|nr:lyase family protein [Acidimicrobiales bacterium]